MIPELSVVIPTHDKLPLLQATLAALFAQDLDPDLWEVVVLDDASGDGTGPWLASIAAEWGGRLKASTAERNVGRARARNLGAELARGRWILFLDDDIVAPPDLLSAHHRLLSAHPGCGVIGLVATDPEVVDAPHFHYIDSRGVAKLVGPWAPAKYLVTQNTSVPTDQFRAAGGFDENFKAYGFEDMELGFRLEESQGVKFLALFEPVPRHVHHHDLDTYLQKKGECARGSLQLLGDLYPHRLREMKLAVVVQGAPLRRRLIAAFRHPLRFLVGRWPVLSSSRPVLIGVYARLMDALILATYCHSGILYDKSRDRQT